MSETKATCATCVRSVRFNGEGNGVLTYTSRFQVFHGRGKRPTTHAETVKVGRMQPWGEGRTPRVLCSEHAVIS